jgi:hypothetical protein
MSPRLDERKAPNGLPLLLVAPILAAIRSPLTSTSSPSSLPNIWRVAVLITSVPALVWTVRCFFQGYRTASGLWGVKGALSFRLALFLAEVLSKVVLEWNH